MRLISQSGEFDFPYEQVVLQQDECWIYARLVCESKARNILGEYSTPEKAKKVMEMVRSKYGEYLYCEGGQMATMDFYVPAFAFTPPKVFQFPEDDEVEV